MESSDTREMDLTRAASTFAALGSEQRLAVLQVLVRAGPEGLTIGELGERAGVKGSTLTHHMKILAAADLVQQSRKGREIICVGAAYSTVESIAGFLLDQCCADSAKTKAGTRHG